ncbi:MAG: division/cell wall cluster transcriptional repressor MraZ [Bacilli bacterium]
MLIGEFHHNLDEKQRLVIPTKYRMELGDSFVLTRGLENCLYAYSNKEWEKLVNKISMLPFNKKDTRTFSRSFFSGATVCEFDKSGRINITSPLVSYAGLKTKCVIIGVNDHLEIWDEDAFNKFLNDNASSLEDIAENLFDETVTL